MSVLTHFLKSQMRTLSDPAVYKLPDTPMHSAVMGVSPAGVKPKLAVPDIVLPDEVSVFTAFALPDRISHTLMNAPHAENNKFDARSYSMATTGPGCGRRHTGPLVFSMSHTRTVRSTRGRQKDRHNKIDIIVKVNCFQRGISAYFLEFDTKKKEKKS